MATGCCGTWPADALSHGEDRALLEPPARAAAAEGKDGELLAFPPGTVVQTVGDAGRDRHALPAMPTYVKIKAVAVAEDTRGQGLGAALPTRCVQVDGRFGIDRVLGPSTPGRTTDVGFVLTGRPISLGAGPRERLFFR